ncbi:MAG: ROK family protein [Eubacteriales bacterium]|nr:ROK family protein [Eubacteriales bacterium]MDD4105260.1 ROK family protein [Eubacteriales bacterium]MDD4710517.1 ROK family protein [Eubacteriales bacterium]
MQLKVPAELDPNFQPLSVLFRQYHADVQKAPRKQRFVCALERNGDHVAVWETLIFPDNAEEERTVMLLERIVKSLLWIHGGYRISISGSRSLYEHLKAAYAPHGARAFDADFMQTNVYEKPFEILYCENPDDIAEAREGAKKIGRHLNGCRIGFDAGGSDRKVSAVIDGEAVFSEEIIWHPKTAADPNYHYKGILSSMRSAAAHLPRVDAIGVSSAGIYIDNKIMNASLFLQVPVEDFKKNVSNMYINIAKEIGDVPLVVANDGDVTALAGAMEMNVGNVLGIAMGTSEAGGYVNKGVEIMGWLNELAFVPIDVAPNAMADEWSGDIGCGVKYFSQDGVIKLAPAAGIHLNNTLTPAEKLTAVQNMLKEGHEGAAKIFRTIGVCFGYAVAYYALFYEIDHVLIMGRVTSGNGGSLLIQKAQEVLDRDFPDLAAKITLHLPDEKSRRVGQSVAAASLPEIR